MCTSSRVPDDDDELKGLYYGFEGMEFMSKAIADHFTHARQDIPRLIAEAREAQRLRGEISRLCTNYCPKGIKPDFTDIDPILKLETIFKEWKKATKTNSDLARLSADHVKDLDASVKLIRARYDEARELKNETIAQLQARVTELEGQLTAKHNELKGWKESYQQRVDELAERIKMLPPTKRRSGTYDHP